MTKLREGDKVAIGNISELIQYESVKVTYLPEDLTNDAMVFETLDNKLTLWVFPNGLCIAREAE